MIRQIVLGLNPAGVIFHSYKINLIGFPNPASSQIMLYRAPFDLGLRMIYNS